MKIALAAAAVALCPLSLSAATLTVTNVTGQWTGVAEDVAPTPEADRSADTQGIGTNAISWGKQFGDGALSGYVFDGLASNANSANVGFAMGTFTHNNNTISQFSSISQAKLRVAFSFFIDADPDEVFTRVAEFKFAHDETPNKFVNGAPVVDAGPCADGGMAGAPGVNVKGCADRVTVRTNPRSTEAFEIAGKRFVFDVTGFRGSRTFLTTEEKSNSIQLFGRFTEEGNVVPPASVPLPAAGGLLLAALGAVGLARRRGA